jgi:hemin uptake protein HemP
MSEKSVDFDPKPIAPLGVPLSAGRKPRVESAHLFQGEREIVIVHQAKEYRLRITRNGKLILTK